MRHAFGTAVVATALMITGIAAGADIGANDDTGKYASFDAGSLFFQQMASVGLRQSVMTTRFVPSQPTTIQDQNELDVAIPLAQLTGLRVSLAVYPYPPREVESGLASPTAFAAWLTLVAQRYPTVKHYVVLNEPNQPAFVRPQFRRDGTNASAATAGALLAASYDALKAIDPTIQVIGLGLSPRGNDRPAAASNVSTSPVRFLTALGSWYRASGRSLPLMDGLSFHPYPNQATDRLDRGYPWPNAGFSNLDRIKQAFWDAFHGTAQPTTVEGLKISLDEVGWQVDTAAFEGYTGTENVRVTTEASQALTYAELVRRVACDPQIAELNFFGFYDDRPRDAGFQAGLNRVDGTPRASADAVRAAIIETAAGCTTTAVSWRPTVRVVGAAAPQWSVTTGQMIRSRASADERAVVLACVLQGRVRGSAAAAAMARRTAKSPGCTSGAANPSRPAKLTLRRKPPFRASTLAVRLVAEANAARSSTFTSSLR